MNRSIDMADDIMGNNNNDNDDLGGTHPPNLHLG